MRNFTISLILVVAAVAGCAPQGVTPPADSTECEGACSVLHDLDCPEGRKADCVSTCERIVSIGYLWTDSSSGPKCVVRQKKATIASIRACNIRCLK